MEVTARVEVVRLAYLRDGTKPRLDPTSALDAWRALGWSIEVGEVLDHKSRQPIARAWWATSTNPDDA